MLSATGRSSGIVPPSSSMVLRTFLPTSKCVWLAFRFPFMFSRRKDGKYLDLSSVKSVTAPNGHRRIEASIYVSMPAANMIQGLSVQYDYQMDRSLRHLINAHDKSLKQGDKTPYISIWRAKQGNSGITGTVNDGGTYYNDGQIRQQRVYKENLNAMILPADFGDEKYKLPNLLYQKAYGIAYDDET